MSVWKKFFGGGGEEGRVDYYDEGMELLSDGKFHEALTSLRLALKEQPGDPVVLQQIAIAYTRIGMTDEAANGLPPYPFRADEGCDPPPEGFSG
jgi:predicted Zn-dependent protease